MTFSGQKVVAESIDGKTVIWKSKHLPLKIYGPRREKTCLRGFRQSEIQTSLLSYNRD